MRGQKLDDFLLDTTIIDMDLVHETHGCRCVW